MIHELGLKSCIVICILAFGLGILVSQDIRSDLDKEYNEKWHVYCDPTRNAEDCEIVYQVIFNGRELQSGDILKK